jgi:hypothetical protein
MIHQYRAQRFMFLDLPGSQSGVKGDQQSSVAPRTRRIGTIPVGTIVYIQDGVRPPRGLTQPVVCREPWIVEAWLPRDYSKWNATTRTFTTVRMAGGHLAIVRSLRNGRVQPVADWILLTCIDAGLEKP